MFTAHGGESGWAGGPAAAVRPMRRPHAARLRRSAARTSVEPAMPQASCWRVSAGGVRPLKLIYGHAHVRPLLLRLQNHPGCSDHPVRGHRACPRVSSSHAARAAFSTFTGTITVGLPRAVQPRPLRCSQGGVPCPLRRSMNQVGGE
jgi:hypothetical protein